MDNTPARFMEANPQSNNLSSPSITESGPPDLVTRSPLRIYAISQ